jgi:hypothetical protein
LEIVKVGGSLGRKVGERIDEKRDIVVVDFYRFEINPDGYLRREFVPEDNWNRNVVAAGEKIKSLRFFRQRLSS